VCSFFYQPGAEGKVSGKLTSPGIGMADLPLQRGLQSGEKKVSKRVDEHEVADKGCRKLSHPKRPQESVACPGGSPAHGGKLGRGKGG